MAGWSNFGAARARASTLSINTRRNTNGCHSTPISTVRSPSASRGDHDDDRLADNGHDIEQQPPRVHVVLLGHPDEVAGLDLFPDVSFDDLPGHRARYAHLVPRGPIGEAPCELDVLARAPGLDVVDQAGPPHLAIHPHA